MEGERELVDADAQSVSQENASNGAELQPAPAVQAEQPSEKGSQVDVESLLEEMRAEQRREREAMLEEIRRVKQSFRDVGDSIVQRVQQEYGKRKGVIDELEQDGTLTREEAVVRRARLREQVEAEELAKQAPAIVPPAERTKPADEPSPTERKAFEITAKAIFEGSGLDPKDPEFEQTTKRIDTRDLEEAVNIYRKRVEKAKADKVKRLQAEKTASLQKAQASAVPVNVGGGQAATVDKEAELQKLLENTPSDPRELQKYEKRLRELLG